MSAQIVADLVVGARSNRLEIVEVVHRNKGERQMVRVRCDCGTEKTIRYDSVKSGKSQSCGCYGIQRLKETHTKHGGASGYRKSPEYSVWCCMNARCNNPSDDQYHDYGGRGIKIEYADFQAFLDDVGERPNKTDTIERYDTNGNYGPGLCGWESRAVNNKNTRRSKRWCVHSVWYDTCGEAAKANNVGVTTILAWCDGAGNRPPKQGCYSVKKYPDAA